LIVNLEKFGEFLTKNPAEIANKGDFLPDFAHFRGKVEHQNLQGIYIARKG
jgi:hypothetical protein